jgi:competence protein ComEA
MQTINRHRIRQVLSLGAFTTLIAAVTLAFANAPTERTYVNVSKAQRTHSFSPAPYIPLAKAKPTPSTKKASTNASARSTSAKRQLVGTLNINKASAKELTLLPGVGPKKAQAIVRWREKNRRFLRVVDLRRVKGFGAKSVKKLLPYLSVSGDNSLRVEVQKTPLR